MTSNNKIIRPAFVPYVGLTFQLDNNTFVSK